MRLSNIKSKNVMKVMALSGLLIAMPLIWGAATDPVTIQAKVLAGASALATIFSSGGIFWILLKRG